MINLNELRDNAYRCAYQHGFHDIDYPIEHWLMLVITEISEMVDADRKDRHSNKDAYIKATQCIEDFETHIKDTFEDEMADVVIRLFDLAGLIDTDLSRIYQSDIDNACTLISRKLTESITCVAYYVTRILTNSNIAGFAKIQFAIISMFAFAKEKGIDLEWHIEQKMRYNETRPMLNGKNY